MKQKDGRTALICAAAFGRLECTRLLVEAGADKEVKDSVRSM
jgi:ankyrin repeat protein